MDFGNGWRGQVPSPGIAWKPGVWHRSYPIAKDCREENLAGAGPALAD